MRYKSHRSEMVKCRVCGSYAINPGHQGRPLGESLTLCDVCYWREQYDSLKMKFDLLTESNKTTSNNCE